MQITKRLIAMALIGLATVGGASAKEWQKIRIGSEGAYPPFNYMDSNNELKGFDIDIGKALCDEMKVECEFVSQDWDGMIPALLAHKYDAIMASMSITEERKQQVAFSDKYYATPASFIAPKDSKITNTSPEAMKDKTIGGQSSTTHATLLEDVYGKAGATIKLYATQDEANLDLSNGRLDAVLADKVVLLEWLDKAEEGKCCTFVGDDVRDATYFGEGIGIAMRKDDEELKAKFNEAIAAIIKNGTYKKINDAYFPFSVY
jgi:polar amino acid transport system substrate-binding protein